MSIMDTINYSRTMASKLTMKCILDVFVCLGLKLFVFLIFK